MALEALMISLMRGTPRVMFMEATPAKWKVFRVIWVWSDILCLKKRCGENSCHCAHSPLGTALAALTVEELMGEAYCLLKNEEECGLLPLPILPLIIKL